MDKIKDLAIWVYLFLSFVLMFGSARNMDGEIAFSLWWFAYSVISAMMYLVHIGLLNYYWTKKERDKLCK